MTDKISDRWLSQLSERIAAQMGVRFPRERWHDLERGIGFAAREFGFQDAESCIPSLLSSPLTRRQVEVLASHLTVGETYFFREKKSYEILEGHILPELIRSRRGAERHLRIWSAGCATGEEPYSIAILLHRLIPYLTDWTLTILATDINPRFLRKASQGLYTEWSFRNTPPWVKERYFTVKMPKSLEGPFLFPEAANAGWPCRFRRKKEGRWEILPQIQERVTFSYLNLARDPYPSPLNNTQSMDVIFCRNVLIYFGPEQAKRVIQNLYLSLVDGGWLIVSPSEASQVLFSQFSPVRFPDAILYRKEARGKRATPGDQAVEASPFSERFPFAPIQSDDFGPSPAAAGSEPGVPMERPPAPLDFHLPLPGVERSAAGPEEPGALEPRPTPYLEALSLYERGRYAEAAEQLRELLSQDREASRAMALLARASANQGRLAEAREWSEKAIAANQLNVGLHYLRAMILQEEGTLNEAMVSLRRALFLDQKFVLAHFAMANLTLRQGKRKESDKHFENVLGLLSACRQEDLLPESEGMTAGRLREIVRSTSQRKF